MGSGRRTGGVTDNLKSDLNFSMSTSAVVFALHASFFWFGSFQPNVRECFVFFMLHGVSVGIGAH
jgi:hypothetical protein